MVLSIHDGSLNWRRLHYVLRDMRRPQVRTLGLGLQFGLDIDAY